jgi:hypothetical protein
VEPVSIDLTCPVVHSAFDTGLSQKRPQILIYQNPSFFQSTLLFLLSRILLNILSRLAQTNTMPGTAFLQFGHACGGIFWPVLTLAQKYKSLQSWHVIGML